MAMFEGYIVAHTDSSIFFHGHYWDKPDWLPRSQIDILPEPDTREVRVITSNWITDKKGLSEFHHVKEETDDERQY